MGSFYKVGRSVGVRIASGRDWKHCYSNINFYPSTVILNENVLMDNEIRMSEVNKLIPKIERFVPLNKLCVFFVIYFY